MTSSELFWLRAATILGCRSLGLAPVAGLLSWPATVVVEDMFEYGIS